MPCLDFFILEGKSKLDISFIRIKKCDGTNKESVRESKLIRKAKQNSHKKSQEQLRNSGRWSREWRTGDGAAQWTQ